MSKFQQAVSPNGFWYVAFLKGRDTETGEPRVEFEKVACFVPTVRELSGGDGETFLGVVGYVNKWDQCLQSAEDDKNFLCYTDNPEHPWVKDLARTYMK